jgi:predicted N-acyltransferase
LILVTAAKSRLDRRADIGLKIACTWGRTATSCSMDAVAASWNGRMPEQTKSATELSIRVVPAIAAIPSAQWDACANPNPRHLGADQAEPAGSGRAWTQPDSNCQGREYNPFISHAFLHALEASGSATGQTGWQPQHLVAEAADGGVLGVLPCYLKSHSRGEYVFDHGWADAYERAGGQYYPKLQVSVPFTPVTGRRLLAARKAPTNTVHRALAAGLVELCRIRDASSAHITFATESEWRLLGQEGFLQRIDQQYHWFNADYRSFDDFLAALAARKRKIIKRERRDALAPGIEVVWLTGSDVTESVWDTFFAFYMETGSRKWGRPYLTRKFYSMIGEAMADRILLVLARRAGRFIAGAINFIGSHALYGRHWGAIEHHPFLHFEVCYYQAIDFAIQRGLKVVEAGAQGEHKLARGYLPQTTYSAHFIADPDLRRAIADYLKRERAYVAEVGRELAESGPFRKAADEA